METYESIRHRIPHFDEMAPEQRNEMFGRVWKLRQHVENNQDSLPKPGAPMLHDALTHAALFFIEVYDREQRLVSPEEIVAVEPWGRLISELTPDSGELALLDEYRKRLKVS